MANLIVGTGDMKVSNDPNDVLVTYALGSCIGLIIYDPEVKVGGMLHFMLPESSLNREKARKNPYMFADTGIPELFRASYRLGAQKHRMQVIVAGGSQILDQNGFFNIGKRNHLTLRKMLFKNNVIIHYEDVGGQVNRTVKLEIRTGNILTNISGRGDMRIWPPLKS
ncbi:MAG: chemotaxis protein CheD [bacterium]